MFFAQTLQGYGHLESGNFEYRGAFHADQMHGLGVFKIRGERWGRDFRRLGPSLVAVRMENGEPASNFTESVVSSSSSPASADLVGGGGGIAVWAAGSPELQECLVEQHAKSVPIPGAVMAPHLSHQDNRNSGDNNGGDDSPPAAASPSSPSSSGVSTSEAELSARDLAWFQAAPNPLVAYCARCKILDGKLVVVEDLSPVILSKALFVSATNTGDSEGRKFSKFWRSRSVGA